VCDGQALQSKGAVAVEVIARAFCAEILEFGYFARVLGESSSAFVRSFVLVRTLNSCELNVE